MSQRLCALRQGRTRFQACGDIVIDKKVTNMGVAAKELDRGMFIDVSDRLVNGTESARTRICADGIMTSHNVHVDWFRVVNCI